MMKVALNLQTENPYVGYVITFNLSETTLLSIILAKSCMLVYMVILLFVCFNVFIYQLYIERII